MESTKFPHQETDPFDEVEGDSDDECIAEIQEDLDEELHERIHEKAQEIDGIAATDVEMQPADQVWLPFPKLDVDLHDFSI